MVFGEPLGEARTVVRTPVPVSPPTNRLNPPTHCTISCHRSNRCRRRPRPGEKTSATEFEELKRRIHGKLVDKLDLSRVGDLEGDVLRREIRLVVEHLCDTEDHLLNRSERERLIDEVLDETFGLGPLEVLLKDPTISDILINGPKKIYVERRGKMEKTTSVPRQRPPDADHRPHRVEGRPARRRSLPDGRRPLAGRLAASTRSFRRWPWTAPRFRFAASAPIRSSWKTCSTTRPSRRKW